MLHGAALALVLATATAGMAVLGAKDMVTLASRLVCET